MEKEGGVKGLESAWLRCDRTALFVRENAKAIQDENGKILYYEGTVEDVTERKKAEEALKESEDKFKTLSEESFDSIIIHDVNEVLEVNRTFTRVWAYEPDEVRGISVKKFITPESYELVLENISSGFEKPYEISAIKKDGTIFPIEIAGRQINYKGKKVRIATARDITERKRVEEEIRKFKTISDRAEYGIAISDLEGNLLYLNESFAQMHGYTPEELIGKNLSIFHNEEQMKSVNRLKNQLIQKESYVTEEVWHKRKDNTVFLTSLNGTLVKDEKGKPLFMAATAIDITERKRAEESLKKSAQLLRDTGEMAKVGGWELDLSTKEVLWTEEVGRIHGVEPGYKPKLEEALNFYAPESRPALESVLKKAAETGEPYDLESLFIPSGSKDKIWVRSLGRAVYSDGKIVKLAGAFQNIDKYKRAEEALRESEERYRLLADNVSDVIWTMDLNFKFTYFSPSIKQALGYTPEEIISKRPDEVITPASYELVKKVIAEEMEIEMKGQGDLLRSRTVEVEEVRKDGTTLWVEIKASFLRDANNKAIGILGITRDIDERKKMETQLIQTEKLAAVGTLAYGIAHEFNNILAGMLANAELGLITQDSRQIKECFEIIADNSHRAASITNNLLAFARQKEARKELIDITEPLRSVLAVTRRDLEKLNLEIAEKFKPIPKIYCDAGQLSEVFLNMITNARDAMREKGGVLTIQVESDRDNIRIIFKDTGCGIPKELKGKIFEPFVTSKGALGGSEIPGTGLGLFLSYGIIDGYQGKIEVESKVGKGTQFIISIPVSKNLPPQPVQEIKNEPSGEIERKLKILLVDDEETIVSGLKKFLESRGHQVTSSLRGNEGLKLFKKDKFDLVLSDITMPDMDGIELIKKIKEQDQKTRVIVITGHIMREMEEKAKEAGADEVLIKPFKNEMLCLAISKFMTEI